MSSIDKFIETGNGSTGLRPTFWKFFSNFRVWRQRKQWKCSCRRRDGDGDIDNIWPCIIVRRELFCSISIFGKNEPRLFSSFSGLFCSFSVRFFQKQAQNLLQTAVLSCWFLKDSVRLWNLKLNFLILKKLEIEQNNSHLT